MSASNVVLYDTNVSNFVWKSQMLCLLDSNNMAGIVDDTFVGPRFSCTETERRYNSLAKGWILGSVTEEVLANVHSLDSAKAVWEKLKSNYDPIVCQQKGKEVVRDADSIEIKVVPTETDTKKEDKQSGENRNFDFSSTCLKLREATTSGDWPRAEKILKEDKHLYNVTEPITWDGSTILHMAVGVGHKDFIEQLCSYLTDDQVLQQRETDGSTALHIAAIVGNTHAADILVKKNRELLRIKNKNGIEPLKKAYEHMHLDTILYLLKAVNDDAETESQSSSAASVHPDDEIGVGLLVNAISAKQYSLKAFEITIMRSSGVFYTLSRPLFCTWFKATDAEGPKRSPSNQLKIHYLCQTIKHDYYPVKEFKF